MPTLEDAIFFACQAHKGQKEKIGNPYILHPLRVMFRVEGEYEKMAAVLHDVVEDSSYTLEDLEKAGYPCEVIDAVACLTKQKGEAYSDFILRVKKNPIACRVKIADIEDNMDVRRLPGVGEKDFERLKKYLAAWKELKELEKNFYKEK